MRIFTKRSFGFTSPNGGTLDVEAGVVVPEVVRTQPNQFQDVPDWVQHDDMFKWGQADGNIEVVQAQVAVATSGDDAAQAPKNGKAAKAATAADAIAATSGDDAAQASA